MTAQFQSSDNSPSLMVGIGASAGGLEAFSEIFRNLPDNLNMAFILVQHLEPEQQSLLSELLSRETQMSVCPAEDGMAVEANRVYVILPGNQMTIAQGYLRLKPVSDIQERAKTVDVFFQSLATDQKNKAIAIVLSGSNADGAFGIQQVKEAGGITFAQNRATAKFPEMPDAAIATGQVDFVLPPDRIAEELVKISRHPYVQDPIPQESQKETQSFEELDLKAVFRLLQRNTGVDFSHYRITTFERRLRRRMALNQIREIDEYTQTLQDNPQELQALYKDVLITVTSFFRDSEMYAVLKERVLPQILQSPSAEKSIRIWIPGCATGEEVYSIAICLLESLDGMIINPNIQIFGTDINIHAIDEARSGIYRESRLEGVLPERRHRFFTEVEGGYRINKSVRELCLFAKHDLSNDPPFSGVDLVSCRNVLIYFKSQIQRHILSVFHYSLKPGGFMVLGNSESAGDNSDLFEPFDTTFKIYAKRGGQSRLNFDLITSVAPELPDLALGQGFSSDSFNRADLYKQVDQIMLNRYAPVGVVVNERLDILQFRGDTSPYLRPPQGEPTVSLLKMLRPGLLLDIRTAIEQVKQQESMVSRQGLALENQQEKKILLEVIPFNRSADQGRYFLILFQQMPNQPAAIESDRPVETPQAAVEVDERIQHLQKELASTRQELLDTQTLLQLTIQEQDVTHQRLIAANEEILSSNEELKSTNEELQTAKEEIQSSNEEMKTTNEELLNRNAEARRANDDLINLINNINIPILMLSNDLRVRRFTPMARIIFNLIPSDVGRPISDIRLNLDVPNLEKLIEDVIESLGTVEQEVQDWNGQWYLLRIRPYLTVDKHIDGAVVALLDINSLKQTEQELRNSQAQLENELFAINQVQTLSVQLFTSVDLNGALNEVLDAAIAIHHTELGCTQLYNPEQNTLEIVAQRGFADDTLSYFRNRESNIGTAHDRALKSKHRVIIEDVQLDPEFAPHLQIAAVAGFRAVQATPLINRNGELLGVLSTCFRQPHRPPERELRMLDLYARQAAEFIDLIRVQRERQKLLEERERAAQAANASKDEFLSLLSHELRTPMSSILGWAELIQQGTLNKEDTNQAIESIRSSTFMQLELIEALLDTSRIVQDRFQIHPQPTNLTETLQRTIALIQPQMAQKSLYLETDLQPCPENLLVDPNRMQQVFTNLLTNATKFTPDGGQIAATLTYSASQIHCQISDTGRGITADLLPHVFERFRQADSSNRRQEEGLGLGLFLVKSIIEAHGGTVQAESPGENQGTTVTFQLPLKTAKESQPAPPAPPDIPLNLEGVRVLLVDDDITNLALFTFELRSREAIVSTAQNAADAMKIITEQPLDILISDIGLPKVNGYELMQQVRSLPQEQGGQIPAIALTAYASEQDAQRAMEAGFQLHLTKPVGLKNLVEAVYRMVHP